jgi:hypothetical protein
VGGSKSGGGSTAAHAQEQPSSCKQWTVKHHKIDTVSGPNGAELGEVPTIPSGEEPFSALSLNGAYLITRKCAD